MKRAFLFALLFTFVTVALANDHKAPELKSSAVDYPAVDVHTADNVSVAADPFDTPGKASFFSIDYLKYGFIPIRVIVTNNGNAPISLTEARIYFFTGYGDKVLAAEPEDIERRVDTIANPTSPGVVLPAPFPHIHGRSHDKDKQINNDFDTFGFQTLAVEAHTTRAGFLFYNIQGLSDPLKDAKLEVRELRDASGKDLFTFEVPFDKYLAAEKH